MAILNSAPAPIEDPIARPRRPEYKGDQRDPQEGLITIPWVDYFSHQTALTETFPGRVASVSLSTQAASIGATDMSGGTLSAGLYRLTYFIHITQAASFSSSLSITLDWKSDGTTLSFTGADLTKNLVTDYQTGTLFFRLDSLSPVRYSTTYSEVGLTVMQYSVDIVLEEVKA